MTAKANDPPFVVTFYYHFTGSFLSRSFQKRYTSVIHIPMNVLLRQFASHVIKYSQIRVFCVVLRLYRTYKFLGRRTAFEESVLLQHRDEYIIVIIFRVFARP